MATRFTTKYGAPLAVLTNVLPLLLAIYPLIKYADVFHVVFLSVGFGLAATLVVSYSNLRVFRRDRDQGRFHASEAMQPLFDKSCWMLMAAVLLVNSVDEMNRAFYSNQGIRIITSEDYQLPWVGSFTALDVVSLFCGLILMGAMSFIPWLSPPGSGVNARRQYHVLLKRWVITLGFVVAISSALALWFLTKYPAGFIPEDKMPLDIDDISALCALAGVIVFFVSYLGNHRALFDLGLHEKGAVTASNPLSTAATQGKDAELIWQRNLRRLKFEAVFMPPLIAGVALVGGALESGKVVVFGFFVYGGFGLWSLAIKVVRDSRNGIRATVFGLGTIGFQFVYALMMTVLWTMLLLKLQSWVGSMAAFKIALNVILAAIFIEVVFGPVYRNVWARALSDEWIQASPEYVIVATAICACLAALHQEWYKPCVVIFAVLLSIIGPAATVRRSLTAYVLIRVRPGYTESVRRRLFAADLNSSVLFGEYDVLVKLEVPGRWSILPRDAASDSHELMELAALVHKEIRCLKGEIIETQTLLDFSDYVDPPDENEKATVAPATPV